MLNERKTRILKDLMQTYVREAHPVGSEAILERSGLDLSPATVRHEMLELEREGYLWQPHTSAGRIPTEKGWRFYLDHLLKEREVSKDVQQELTSLVRSISRSRHELMKRIAQTLAEHSRGAVFVAFAPNDTYYTGISKLFNQPEFDEVDVIRDISRVVDRLEELMADFHTQLREEVTVLLGSENPFSQHCGLVLTSVPHYATMLGLLGPIRQDYAGHMALARFTRHLVSHA